MKIRASLGAVLAAVALTTVTTTAVSASEPLKHVAMGDSFAAGAGILPVDDSPAAGICARSSVNYAHVISSAIGSSLTDVSCSSAATKHFSQSQYPGIQLPQFDALTADTDLVTLTIGGNDQNVTLGLVSGCISAGIATLGFGTPCKNIYGSTFDTKIDTLTYPAVKAALQGIKARAPQARIAILGYPWVLPATTGCYFKFPVAPGDIPYVRGVQAHLNAKIQQAANETGATFVDLSVVSNGHDACKPVGTRWIEPTLYGTNYIPMHPNALGESQMAAQTLSVLNLN